MDLGVIGSCAKCEEEQKAIHKALLNIQPLGWENQINNALIINYSASIEQGLFLSRTFELAGFIDVRAGTLYDDLSGGFYFRYGLMNSYFKHLGIIKNSTNNKFQFYLNAKVKTRFVAYNATLQGAPFSSSIYVIEPERITRSVFIANCGLVLAYKRISFEFSKYYLTKEFFRGIDHGWGRCNITVCF